MATKQAGSARESGAVETTLSGKTAISRREFARRAVLATASAAAIPAGLLDETRKLPGSDAVRQNAFENAPQRGLPDSSQSAPQNAAAVSVSANEIEVENKFDNILSQYGSRFSEEQKADIRRLVGEMQKPLDRLRAFSLDNSDQPATVLKPLMDRKPHVPDGVPGHAQGQAPAGASDRAPTPRKRAK
ncbi:MAG TPA: hypothetical protein VOA41_11110 [Candidatus Dormibacteraeota bacterium]|nr:hypothetical protein [Candidatus Dormibacteraeota bacterium]